MVGAAAPSLQRLAAVKESFLVLANERSSADQKLAATQVLDKLNPETTISLCIELFDELVKSGSHSEVMVFSILNRWIIAIARCRQTAKIESLQKFLEQAVFKNARVLEYILSNNYLRVKLQQLCAYILCIVRPKDVAFIFPEVPLFLQSVSPNSNPDVCDFVVNTLCEVLDQLVVINDSKSRAHSAVNKISLAQRNLVIDDIAELMRLLLQKISVILPLMQQRSLSALSALAAKYVVVLCATHRLRTLSSTEAATIFELFRLPAMFAGSLPLSTTKDLCAAVEALTAAKPARNWQVSYEYYDLQSYKQIFSELTARLLQIVYYVISNEYVDEYGKAGAVLNVLLVTKALVATTAPAIWLPKLDSLVLLFCYTLNHPYLAVNVQTFAILNTCLSRRATQKGADADALWQDGNVPHLLSSLLCRLVKTVDCQFKPLDDMLLISAKSTLNAIKIRFAFQPNTSWREHLFDYSSALDNESNQHLVLQQQYAALVRSFAEFVNLLLIHESEAVVNSFLALVRSFVASVLALFDPKTAAFEKRAEKFDCPLQVFLQLLSTLFSAFADVAAPSSKRQPANVQAVTRFVADLLQLLIGKPFTRLDFFLLDRSAGARFAVDAHVAHLEKRRLELLQQRCAMFSLKSGAPHSTPNGESKGESKSKAPSAKLAAEPAARDAALAETRQALCRFLLSRIFLDVEAANALEADQLYAIAAKSADVLRELYTGSLAIGASLSKHAVQDSSQLLSQIPLESQQLLQHLGAQIARCPARHDIGVDLILSLVTSVGTHDIIKSAVSAYLGDIIEANTQLLAHTLASPQQLRAAYLSLHARPAGAQRDENALLAEALRGLSKHFAHIDSLFGYVVIPETLEKAALLGFVSHTSPGQAPKNRQAECYFRFVHPLTGLLDKYLPLMLAHFRCYVQMIVSEPRDSALYSAIHFVGADFVHSAAVKQRYCPSAVMSQVYDLPQYQSIRRNEQIAQLNKQLRVEFQKVCQFFSTLLKFSVATQKLSAQELSQLVSYLAEVFAQPALPYVFKTMIVRHVVADGLLAHLDGWKLPTNNSAKAAADNEAEAPQVCIYTPDAAFVEYGLNVALLYLQSLSPLLVLDAFDSYRAHARGDLYNAAAPQSEAHSVLFFRSEQTAAGYACACVNALSRLLSIPSAPIAAVKNYSIESLKTVRFCRAVYHNQLVCRLFDFSAPHSSLMLSHLFQIARLPLPPSFSLVNSTFKCFLRALGRRLVQNVTQYSEAVAITAMNTLSDLIYMTCSVGLYRYEILLDHSKPPVLDVAEFLKYGAPFNKTRPYLDMLATSLPTEFVKTLIRNKKPEFFSCFKLNSKELSPNSVPTTCANLLLEIYKTMCKIFLRFVHLKLAKDYIDKPTFLQNISQYPPFKQALLFFSREDLGLPHSIQVARLVDMAKHLDDQNDSAVYKLCFEFIHENVKALYS